jgi:CheY-like chemotaxis protein
MKRKDPVYKYNYVMLLDDNELDNFINEKTIEATYFSNKIYVNTGSRSALEFLTNLSILSKEVPAIFPEVIFVDINMPMIDGFQFIDNFYKAFPQKVGTTKIIILSSSISKDDRDKAHKLSKHIVFLSKPLTQEALSKI